MGFFRNLIFRIATKLLAFLIEHYFGFWVEGSENFPKGGPVIVVANHQSYLDVPLIGTWLLKGKTLARVSWVIGKKTYHNPHLQWFCRLWPVIVVNGTVVKASHALKEGRILIIFPEGYYAWHRCDCVREGKPVPERRIGNSAAILGLKTGCLIIPIGIFGTEEALPPYSLSMKRKKLGLRIGKPFHFDPPEPEQVTDEMIAKKTKFIMDCVDELS